MKSILLAAGVSIGLLSCPHARADVVQNVVFITESGTAFYYSVSPKECKNKVVVGGAYKCDLDVDTKGGVSTITFAGGLNKAYGVNPGNILVTDKDGKSDLIKFPGTVQNGKVTLAISILFYSLADDKDTDKSIDTEDKTIFEATVDGGCTSGKTCSTTEKDLSAESDTVNGTTITFDGKMKDVPSLAGASGIAFTVTGKQLIGATPVYPDTTIRYIFVSDTACEPKPPGKSGTGSDTICSVTPEPPMAAPVVASLLVMLWLVQWRWSRRRPGIRV